MGGLFKSKTKVTQAPFEQNPWEPQQGFLKSGFNQAQTALNKSLATNAGITDYTADMNAVQTGALSASNTFNAGVMPGAQTAVDTGTAGIAAAGQFQGNASDLYTRAGADRTDSIVGNANKFAANPGLQGQIDSALGDVRKAFDQNLGGINADAAGTGNINSTRTGVVESLARDDAMDRAANISAQMRGDAYNTGLGLASQNISDQFNQQGNANQQVGASVDQAAGLLSDGQQIGQGALAQQLANGSFTQAQAQAEIDGMRAKGMSDQEIVQKYMETIGGSYGQKGYNSSVSQKASPLQQIAGFASSVMGGYGAIKNAG